MLKSKNSYLDSILDDYHHYVDGYLARCDDDYWSFTDFAEVYYQVPQQVAGLYFRSV